MKKLSSPSPKTTIPPGRLDLAQRLHSILAEAEQGQTFTAAGVVQFTAHRFEDLAETCGLPCWLDNSISRFLAPLADEIAERIFDGSEKCADAVREVNLCLANSDRLPELPGKINLLESALEQWDGALRDGQKHVGSIVDMLSVVLNDAPDRDTAAPDSDTAKLARLHWAAQNGYNMVQGLVDNYHKQFADVLREISESPNIPAPKQLKAA